MPRGGPAGPFRLQPAAGLDPRQVVFLGNNPPGEVDWNFNSRKARQGDVRRRGGRAPGRPRGCNDWRRRGLLRRQFAVGFRRWGTLWVRRFRQPHEFAGNISQDCPQFGVLASQRDEPAMSATGMSVGGVAGEASKSGGMTSREGMAGGSNPPSIPRFAQYAN